MINMPNHLVDIAIVQRNRVCKIDLFLSRLQLQLLASAMQEQFPALIHLKITTSYDTRPALALPDRLLGGFASRLRSLKLNRILLPALPKLLLSATNLVCLALWNIPS